MWDHTFSEALLSFANGQSYLVKLVANKAHAYNPCQTKKNRFPPTHHRSECWGSSTKSVLLAKKECTKFPRWKSITRNLSCRKFSLPSPNCSLVLGWAIASHCLSDMSARVLCDHVWDALVSWVVAAVLSSSCLSVIIMVSDYRFFLCHLLVEIILRRMHISVGRFVSD